MYGGLIQVSVKKLQKKLKKNNQNQSQKTFLHWFTRRQIDRC